MSLMQPKIGQTLFIQQESVIEAEAKEIYKSRIQDSDKNYFAIEIPIQQSSGRLKRFYTGEQLNVHFISNGGVKNYFNTQVLGMKEDVIKQLIIKKPNPDLITKIQRRSFLRVPAILEIAVQMTEELSFLALTDDISGGGLSFICDEKYPLEEKSEISCWLLIHFKNETIDHVPFKGQLVRVKPVKEHEKQLVMLSFTEIHDNDREKVIRFCFERQLELRKN